MTQNQFDEKKSDSDYLQSLLNELTDEDLKLDEKTAVFKQKAMRHVLNRVCIDKKSAILAYIDLDNLKKLNDFGEALADIVIGIVGDHLSDEMNKTGNNMKIFRPHDTGDEFIMVLDNSSHEYAFNVAEGIRKYIKSLGIGATLSIGLAVHDNKIFPNESGDQWKARAEQQMKQAKKKGKNCVYPTPATLTPNAIYTIQETKNKKFLSTDEEAWCLMSESDNIIECLLIESNLTENEFFVYQHSIKGQIRVGQKWLSYRGKCAESGLTNRVGLWCNNELKASWRFIIKDKQEMLFKIQCFYNGSHAGYLGAEIVKDKMWNVLCADVNQAPLYKLIKKKGW